MKNSMKDTINFLNLSRYVASLERQINEAGIQLELRTDFGYLVRLCETLPDKAYPTAMFNPLHHHVGPDNGFWIKGTDEYGKIVHVQAVRFDDLTGTNLAREFESLDAFYTDPSVSAPVGENCRSYAAAAKQITGGVCYHGELWLRPGLDGARGKGLSPLFARMAMAIAMMQWSPDYFYGITYKDIILKGVATLYGYCHIQPGAVYWQRPYRDEPLDAWLVWLTGRDILNLVASDQQEDFGSQQNVRAVEQDGFSMAHIAAE